MSSGKKSLRCERKASGENSSRARSVATASGASAAFSSRCRAAEGDTAVPLPRSAHKAGRWGDEAGGEVVSRARVN